jgi:hypothetical protein
VKRFLQIFLFTIPLFFTFNGKADDIWIPFGQNLVNPPIWKYLGGGINLDATAWKTLGYDETAWVKGGSALGFGASPPARNTAIPENTTAGGGGTVGARYPTMYFRRVINIPTLAVYVNFLLRTKFDDGIVVWINGTQAYINNIAAAPSYATLATTAITNNGADIFSATLNNSLFVAGDNVIAVEIHQNALNSTDLFFDLELTGVNIAQPADVVFFPFGQNLGGAPAWKYKGGGTNLDAVAWKSLAYAEPSWVNGSSALGFGANPPVRNTAIPEDATAGGGGISGNRYPTMYFRKIVNVPDPTIFTGFSIKTKFDDGIVVWVNGVEAFRNNINANPSYVDLAPTAIANNGADIYTTTVPKTMFIAGDNIIAVEIHQNAVTSSDLFFDMELTGIGSTISSLTRGPYLQVGKQDSISIRWRTNIPTDSRVTWGTTYGAYTNSLDLAPLTTEHIVRIGGLVADRKYWYTIGSTNQLLQASSTNYFLTLPRFNTTRKLRFLAIGDCGNASLNQVNVKNTFLEYIGQNDIDAMILLGDNAYNTGTDLEFQTNFFNIYKDDILRYNKLYPAPGNHDYGNSTTNTGLRNMPYHLSFTVPMAGEIGGVPSGVQNYYSFNIGDVHFISLDSYGKDDANTTNMYDTSGAQATWLKADLAANTKKWTVAYFHHPPYTKTSHTSDTETDLIRIREVFIRILERNGVDLVLCGHSHGYERSYLLKGFYNTFASPLLDANFNAATHTATGNTQNGKYDGTANSCSYSYNSGKYNHGSMYIVSGSAGQLGGTTAGYPQDCMYYSNATNGGCLYFEVDSNRLDVKFISYATAPTPLVRDQFTIFKDVNKVQDFIVLPNTPLRVSASWRGTYLWPNNGSVTTQGVAINTSTVGDYNYIVRDANSCLKDSFHVVVTIPLPVLINSFTASLNKDIVALDWSTSQEINNKFFTIERSADGNTFSFLGKVNGAGNSSTIRKYHLDDLQPVDGVNYYRLSQTDIDGVRKNLEVKRITYKGSKDFRVTVLSAGNGVLNIAMHNAAVGMIQMRVIDMMGREVLRENINSATGDFTHTIHLNKGTYVLVLVNSKGQALNTKIIAD